MCHLCRRCLSFDFKVGCQEGHQKSESQIKAEKYSCFNERIYNINTSAKCTDECCNVYTDLTDGSTNKIFVGLMKAKRRQIKT